MSDYMFMLENHLSADQNRVVAEVQAAAASANTNLFLTGGAMRDMLGGFQVRDLDFSLEGNALKVARTVAEKGAARIESVDENRRTAELVFSSGVTAQIGLTRVERYGKPGARPQVTSGTIQEDLRGRDFTINAIALSLNRASRGLLLDPANGLADLERRELRQVSPYAFYDDPVRLFRLIRLRIRLGFSIEERTQQSYANVRGSQLEASIAPRLLFEELRAISGEPAPSEVVKALDEEKLLTVFSPALAGTRINLPGLTRLERVLKTASAERAPRIQQFGPFLEVLTEKLSAKERAALVRSTQMTRSEADLWQKLETRARKLEQALRSARIRRASQVYQILSGAPLDETVHLMLRSSYKPVQDRIRAYYQKYLPAIQEMAPSELEPANVKPGTPRYEKARQELIAYRLDHPPRKPRSAPEVAMAAEGAERVRAH